MELELIIGWIGFLMAVYSVMGNDAPAQVLGTLIASHPNKKWILWLGSSLILVAALVTSWQHYDRGIDFDRLTKVDEKCVAASAQEVAAIASGQLVAKPCKALNDGQAETVYIKKDMPPKIEWYYLLGPIGLLLLTRFGVPVSTSFMMLAMFSAGIVLEKIIIKSMVGYGLAFMIALLIWLVLGKLMEHFVSQKKPANMFMWRPLQYLSTGTLWWFWLSHDLANIAVFLPRQLSVVELVVVCVVCVTALGLIFRESGGKVHKFVFKGEQDMDIRVATLIDAVYAVLLFVFKEWNNLPMSTTWVFVGLMGGREIGRAIWHQTLGESVRTVAVRLGMLTFGAVISLGLVGVVMLLK